MLLLLHQPHLLYAEAVCAAAFFQHIHQIFQRLTLKVSEDVLIPRFDTEILVEAVIDYCRDTYKDKALQKIHMLDMCTGSGCIAITLAQNIKNASVAGSDISEAALEIAEENNEKYGRKVLFTKSDLFEKINGKFDVIVSNPPYIKSADIDGLMPEVRLHDPYIALDGKADGLEFIRKIAFTSVSFLNSNGALFFEIGSDEGNDTADIMKAAGFKNLRILKDLSGLDRVAAGNI
jgi:release factor glutamine methyltransferase